MPSPVNALGCGKTIKSFAGSALLMVGVLQRKMAMNTLATRRMEWMKDFVFSDNHIARDFLNTQPFLESELKSSRRKNIWETNGRSPLQRRRQGS